MWLHRLPLTKTSAMLEGNGAGLSNDPRGNLYKSSLQARVQLISHLLGQLDTLQKILSRFKKQVQFGDGKGCIGLKEPQQVSLCSRCPNWF